MASTLVHSLFIVWASLVGQMVKNLPAMQKMLVQSLGQEDPLEKEMATHSSILACRIPWTEESGQTRLNDSHFHFPGVFTDCYV